jgi:GAF domain-containing protein
LNLQEALSAVAVRLRYSIPYDAFAVFEISDDRVTPCFVFGENLRQISSLRVPVGEGLVGWVGETGQSIVNGNPAVEPGYVEAGGSAGLKSALAIPLRSPERIVGVLALYHAQAEVFSAEHLAHLEKQKTELEAGIEKLFERRSESPAPRVSVEKKDLENGSRVAAAKAGA